MSRANIEPGESNIEVFTITSNYGPTENFAPRCIELTLYESAFDSTVRARAKFVDAGYNPSDMTAHDTKFNLTGGEKTELVVRDSYDNKLEYTGDYHLRIRKHQREQYSSPSNTYINYYTEFYSKESMENHLVERRATKKYEGLPHDHITTLLKEDLKTPKSVETDTTIIPYNFLGYSEKVFHHCANLCNKGCAKDPGILAGFLFYEVAKGTASTGGYRYKSIDLLFERAVRRRFIFNNTTKLPWGYDAKILNFYENISANVDSEILSGSLFKRELRQWQPYLKIFDETEFDFKSQNQVSNNAGKEFYKIAADLNLQDKSTRFSTRHWDNSPLPHGKTWPEQQPHSKELLGLGNYDIEKLVRQSVDRFNQLLGIQITILIPMDLRLHVGDLVFCDFPEINKDKTEVNKNRSGIYMILDIGHRITPKATYTSLHLSRDSTIYRK